MMSKRVAKPMKRKRKRKKCLDSIYYRPMSDSKLSEDKA